MQIGNKLFQKQNEEQMYSYYALVRFGYIELFTIKISFCHNPVSWDGCNLILFWKRMALASYSSFRAIKKFCSSNIRVQNKTHYLGPETHKDCSY